MHNAIVVHSGIVAQRRIVWACYDGDSTKNKLRARLDTKQWFCRIQIAASKTDNAAGLLWLQDYAARGCDEQRGIENVILVCIQLHNRVALVRKRVMELTTTNRNGAAVAPCLHENRMRRCRLAAATQDAARSVHDAIQPRN